MNKLDTLEKRQQFAEALAAEAGQLAMRYFVKSDELTVESKNPRDFVSIADREVELMIRDRLTAEYPEDDIVGEEGGGTETAAFWCIDPIDGTSNFLAGIPLWGVSIGYCHKGVPVAGAICIPMLDILLSANENTPGIRHNRELVLERRASPIPTIILGQSPYWGTESFRQAEDIFVGADLECLNYRCSVVGTAFTALGWTHGYYEEFSNIWDVAAGFVITRQAGLKSHIQRNREGKKLTITVLSEKVFDLIGHELALRGAGGDALKASVSG